MWTACKTCGRPVEEWPLIHKNTDFCSQVCAKIYDGLLPSSALDNLEVFLKRDSHA